MMSYVFIALMVLGFAWGILGGNVAEVGNAALSGAGEAITLSISMCGAYALWMGVFNVAEEAGLVTRIASLFRKPLRFLFRDIPKNSKAFGFIALNIAANMLGLGNAATPSGIAAMKELQKHNRNDKVNFTAGEREGPLGDKVNFTAGEREGPLGNKVNFATGEREGHPGGKVASHAMCMLLIINSASVQLIPTGVMAVRNATGSSDAAAVILPTLISSVCAMTFSIVLGKILEARTK